MCPYPQRQLKRQLVTLHLPQPHPALPSCTCPAAWTLCYIPGAGAHALGLGWGGVCGGLTSALPPPRHLRSPAVTP